ncbi:MAG: BMP family protein [Actinobacteria bacterium]|nr:BMP family protein [Actinomycetota bacterium]
MQGPKEKKLSMPLATVLVLALLALAGLVAGCGGGGSSSSGSTEATESTEGEAEAAASGEEKEEEGGGSGSSVEKIAIATPAKANDYGWNEQGVTAAEKVAEEIGAELEQTTDIGYEQTETVLRQMAEKEPGLLIAQASGYDTAAKRVAEEFEVPTVTYDIANEVKPGILTSIITSSQEGAYLAGILAAKTTKSGKVGVVISASDTNWFEMTGGYAAGVHSVDPSMPISFAEISAEGYDDAAGGKRVVTSMIAEGADVIFGMGDGASFGYLQAIETANSPNKVWYIGDIGDMTPIDKKGVLLSSVLWTFDTAFKTFVEQIEEGTFGKEAYDLNLENGGISLLKTKHIPSSVWSEIEKAKKEILAGKIEVPEATTIGAAKAALNE